MRKKVISKVIQSRMLNGSQENCDVQREGRHANSHASFYAQTGRSVSAYQMNLGFNDSRIDSYA
ncbi:MAG: hypothetical protein K9N55_00645 [Phycisphaerae bacterium]|nr:hypothetical protein [Phycisphaerae bacterium]